MADDTRVTHSRSAIGVRDGAPLGAGLPAAAGGPAADIIVRRDQGLTAIERAAVRADAGVRHERMLSLPNTEVVSVPEAERQRALAALERRPGRRGRRAERARARRPHAVCGDLDGGTSRVGLDNNDADVDASEAWEEADAEGSDVTVAVIDQPVDATHPDLGARSPATGETSSVADGCTTRPSRAADHGTHVAGLFAALRDNDERHRRHRAAGQDVAAAGDRQLRRRRSRRRAQGFRLGGQNSIPIAVGSFGTSAADRPRARRDRRSWSRTRSTSYPDTLLVVAAGNEGATRRPTRSTRATPAPATRRNVICVGMSDSNDKPACWSNVGARSVDLFAPGEILSTVGVRPRHGTLAFERHVDGRAARRRRGRAAQGQPGTLERDRSSRRCSAGVDGFGPMGAISVTGGRLNAARPCGGRSRPSARRPERATVSGSRATRITTGPLRRRPLPDQAGTPANEAARTAMGTGVTTSSTTARTKAEPRLGRHRR